MVVIYFSLTPLRGEGKAQRHKAKSHDHIPGADIRNRILGGSDIEDDDPDKAGDKGTNHDWG